MSENLILFLGPYGYSLVEPRQSATNEYHNIFFVGTQEKYSYFLVEKSTLSGAMYGFKSNYG